MDCFQKGLKKRNLNCWPLGTFPMMSAASQTPGVAF